jgi:hypothetical protein
MSGRDDGGPAPPDSASRLTTAPPAPLIDDSELSGATADDPVSEDGAIAGDPVAGHGPIAEDALGILAEGADPRPPNTAPGIDKIQVPLPDEEESPNDSELGDDDPPIQVDYSTKPGEVSIENYDPSHVVTFTEAVTLSALRVLGIPAQELFMPSASEIAKYESDLAFKEMFMKHHTGRIARLALLVRQERRRLLSTQTASAAAANPQNATTGGAIELETEQIRKLKIRRKRKVEEMIESLMRIEEFQNQMEAHERAECERRRQIERARREKREAEHRRHIEHLKELEQQEIRALKEERKRQRAQTEKERGNLALRQKAVEDHIAQIKQAERERAARHAQTVKELERKESERAQRLLEQERQAEEREARRLKQQQDEIERRAAENKERMRQRKRQITAARIEKERDLDRRRGEVEEREKVDEDRILALEQKRREQIRRAAEDQRRRIELNAELKMQMQKERLAEIRKQVKSDEDATKRVEALKKAKQESAMVARTSLTDYGEATRWRAEEERREQLALKHSLDNAAKRTAQKLLEVQAARKREQQLRNFQFQLRQEAVQKNRRQLECQQAVKENEVMVRIRGQQERIDKLQQDKVSVLKERAKILRRLEQERQDIGERMKEVRARAGTDSIQALAHKYGINVDAIRERVQRPRAASKLPPLNPVGGEPNGENEVADIEDGDGAELGAAEEKGEAESRLPEIGELRAPVPEEDERGATLDDQDALQPLLPEIASPTAEPEEE